MVRISGCKSILLLHGSMRDEARFTSAVSHSFCTYLTTISHHLDGPTVPQSIWNLLHAIKTFKIDEHIECSAEESPGAGKSERAAFTVGTSLQERETTCSSLGCDFKGELRNPLCNMRIQASVGEKGV